jgi:hypothetical protein
MTAAVQFGGLHLHGRQNQTLTVKVPFLRVNSHESDRTMSVMAIYQQLLETNGPKGSISRLFNLLQYATFQYRLQAAEGDLLATQRISPA